MWYILLFDIFMKPLFQILVVSVIWYSPSVQSWGQVIHVWWYPICQCQSYSVIFYSSNSDIIDFSFNQRDFVLGFYKVINLGYSLHSVLSNCDLDLNTTTQDTCWYQVSCYPDLTDRCQVSEWTLVKLKTLGSCCLLCT